MSYKLFLVFLIFLLSGSVTLASDDVDQRRPIDVFQVQSPSSYSDCGVANVNASGKIYGGNETAPNEFPWQALLLVDKSISGILNTSEFCEGALIGDRWILTSASCMAVQTGQKVIGVYVFLGVREVPSVNQKTYRDYEIYIHPEWNSTTQAGNVALIKLSTVVEYTQYIRPICLPSSSEPDYINQPVIVTGSSMASTATNGSSGSATAEYHKLITSVISNNQCDAVSNNLMTNRMMCTAGVANSGICKGDRGDPLIFKQTDDTFKQIGIVAFAPTSSTCQTSGTPIAYTRLSSYSNWIQNITNITSSTPPPTPQTTTQSPSSSEPSPPSPSSAPVISGTSSALLFLLSSSLYFSMNF